MIKTYLSAVLYYIPEARPLKSAPASFAAPAAERSSVAPVEKAAIATAVTRRSARDMDDAPPPPPSPLSGCYLLIVLGEPHSPEHRDVILGRVAKGRPAQCDRK